MTDPEPDTTNVEAPEPDPDVEPADDVAVDDAPDWRDQPPASDDDHVAQTEAFHEGV